MSRSLRSVCLLVGCAALWAALAGCSSKTAATPVAPAVPAVSLSAATLSFSAQAVGTSSAVQTVTLSNTGTAALTLNSIGTAGTNAASFIQSNTCGTSVAAGASCTISVYFSPAGAGANAATVTIADSASGSPQSIALTGTGTAPAASLSATTLAFTANTGTTAPAQTVTLSNTGTASLAITSIVLGGANANSFTETNTCGASLAAGANCAITAAFAQSAAGSYAATLTVADNASGSPQTITLTGVETAPAVSLSASALTFTTPAESTSATQIVTLNNTGNGALTISGISLGGANAASFNQTTTCGATLAAGSSCTLTLSLTAYLAQSYAGTATIAGNMPGGSSTISLTGTGTGVITLNTTNAADWVVNNGAVTLDWDPAQFHIFGIHLAGDSNNLVDVTNISSKDAKPLGLYMGNQGLGAGTIYTGSKQVGNAYLDFWVGEQSNATNFMTYEMHVVVTANDPGFHTYYVVNHSATDIAGALSLVLWQFRTNLGLFTHSYQVNSGLNNLGVIDTPIPSPYNAQLNDVGRQVQNAVVDLHGITDTATAAFIASQGREFYTKYDYSTYEYLHKEHGVYGPQYGTWCVLPRTDTIAGGPSKQDVDTLDQIIQQEMSGAHYVGTLNYVPPQGVNTTKMYGPVYFHFNELNATNTTPASLYAEAQTWLPWFDTLYDNDATLTAASYVPSTGRGAVTATVAGTGAAGTNNAWTVLSDPAANYQLTNLGYDYWANNDTSGKAVMTGVVPGTYRLSTYVLGQWGEMRQEGVKVAANQTTTLTGTFVPENFGTATPIWTIGTPDRSAHEFLHAHDAKGNDFRTYQGQFDYWNDFAATAGKQIYYATAVGTTPATNDPNKINYVQWKTFDPGLYAGVYNGSDDTTDGYNYIVPSYIGVANVATASSPGLDVHFTTTAAQTAQGSNVILSLGVASAEGSVVATLNGHQLIWHVINDSDAMVRSGVSGYYQWLVLDWPTTDLNAPGTDNVLNFTSSQIGWMPDAMRLEITNNTGDPATTGWNDYEYVSGSKYTPANDAVANP
ncbi:choice-of-anchor D domain-containing protein [Granulicella rosea]|nr:choice-of-anchor D domain-containing protein [Granulicella rosea]